MAVKDAVDDPYKILACNIVATYSDTRIHQVLHQARAVRRWIYQEVCASDFYGLYLDCVFTDLTSQGKERSVNRTLRGTADFIYHQLDLERLRAEVRNYCKFYGKNID